jgi:hypothetical protein
MFKQPIMAALGAAVALATFALSAHAQENPSQPTPSVSVPTTGDATTTQQTEQNARQRREARNRAAPPPPPTPAENLATAQALATASNTDCQVTLAEFRGVTPTQEKTYEATCARGPGFIFVAATPPIAADCVLLAGQADIERARDPAADVGTQCTIAANMDVLRVVAAYAVEAGVTCTPDQGSSIGRSSEGNLIYEVGCNGVDGYWLERLPDGWKRSECLEIVGQNGICKYSTPAEQVATLKGRFAANAEAAGCDPTEARYMGANANGSFYEAKCAAGNGVIVRFDTTYAVRQVYPCEIAQRIGGGCRLTVVPEAPAVEAPAAQQ